MANKLDEVSDYLSSHIIKTHLLRDCAVQRGSTGDIKYFTARLEAYRDTQEYVRILQQMRERQRNNLFWLIFVFVFVASGTFCLFIKWPVAAAVLITIGVLTYPAVKQPGV
jgi:hypothetical protein